DSPTRLDHERESDLAARKSFLRSFELNISPRRRQTAAVEKCRGFELVVANRDDLRRGDKRQRSDFQKKRAMRGEQRQLRLDSRNKEANAMLTADHQPHD